MNLSNEFEPIRQWARERGLYEKGNVATQSLKLVEEVGELAKSVIEGVPDDTTDAIGDCVVVLTNLAALHGIKIEDAINLAYQVIKDRKGRTENGTFIKDC